MSHPEKKYSKSVAGILQFDKEKTRGRMGVNKNILCIVQFIKEKKRGEVGQPYLSIFVYILPNSKQSPDFGSPGKPNISHVYAKHPL